MSLSARAPLSERFFYALKELAERLSELVE